MANGLSGRTLLAVASHPAVYQARIPLQARLRADPEPLGDARPETLDQDVGPRGEIEGQLDRGRVLQVCSD